MSERESTLVEITREAPCDGRREALLRLVAVAGAALGDAETSRHLRGCKRCRAFVESLRLGGRMARDVFVELEERAAADKRPPVNLAETKAFDRWLERELESRSERDLAYAMARTAQWLLRCDPEVAERLIDPSEDPTFNAAKAKRATINHLRELSKRLSLRWGRTESDVVRSARPNRLDRALAATLDAAHHAALTKPAARLELAFALLKQAHELTGGHLGMVWLAKAHVEWFTGDEENVEGLLERAGGCENCAVDQAAVFQNQALLLAETELSERVITLLTRALACAPRAEHTAHAFESLVVYLTAFGRISEMERAIAAIKQLGMIERTRQRLSPSKLQGYLRYIAVRHSLSNRRTAIAIENSVGAIHGV